MQNKDFLPDFTTFKKTEKEKQELKKAKLNWKKNMKVFHGSKWKEYNNYPETLKG